MYYMVVGDWTQLPVRLFSVLTKIVQARTSFSKTLLKPVDSLCSTAAENLLLYLHDLVGFVIWSFTHLISKVTKYPTKWINSGTSS